MESHGILSTKVLQKNKVASLLADFKLKNYSNQCGSGINTDIIGEWNENTESSTIPLNMWSNDF